MPFPGPTPAPRPVPGPPTNGVPGGDRPASAVLSGVGCVLDGRRVLHGLDLEIRPREAIALLGVNGAGKSTLLKLLAGVRAATTGSVRVDGLDLQQQPAAARTRIGYLPERAPAYEELTVAENVDHALALRGRRGPGARAARHAAIARVDLVAATHRAVGTLSHGQRRRAALAAALAHAPTLLLLDEPGDGLDPVQSAALRPLLRALAQDAALVFSTHRLDEARAVADRVLVLDGGRLALDAPMSTLQASGALEHRFVEIAYGGSRA